MERAQNKHGFGLMAVSLGYFETLMSLSGTSTSSELTSEEQAMAGIPPGLVRMSVGLTGTLAQRWAQLAECYDTVSGRKPLPYRAAEVLPSIFCMPCPLLLSSSASPAPLNV